MRRAIFVLLGAFAGVAQAADSLVLVGTESANVGAYSYVGLLSPLGSGNLGDGFVMRNWIDRLTYRYEGSSTIHATSYGYSPAFGYVQPVGTSHLGLYAGVRIANTDFDPVDRANSQRGTHARFSLQADLATPISAAVDNAFLAQAEIGNGGYYLRERLSFHVVGTHTIGPELIIKGNRDYGAWQAGLTSGGHSIGRLNVLVRVGVSEQRKQNRGGYGGIELSWQP